VQCRSTFAVHCQWICAGTLQNFASRLYIYAKLTEGIELFWSRATEDPGLLVGVTSCIWLPGYGRFGGLCHLHLQFCSFCLTLWRCSQFLYIHSFVYVWSAPFMLFHVAVHCLIVLFCKSSVSCLSVCVSTTSNFQLTFVFILMSPVYFSYRTAWLKVSISGRSCDRPFSAQIFLVPLCLSIS
jgi:hypothetical protein